MLQINIGVLSWMLLAAKVTLQKNSLSSCAGAWVQMNDQNYAQLVERFKHCLNISRQLNGEEKKQFKRKMGEHFATICRGFLENTELPAKDLIKTARNLMRGVAPFLEEDLYYEAGCSSCTSTTQPALPLHPSNRSRNSTVSQSKAKTMSTRDVQSTGSPDMIEISLCDSSPAHEQSNVNSLLYEMLILIGFLALILVQLVLLLCLLCMCGAVCRPKDRKCPAASISAKDAQISKLCDEITERNPQSYSVHHYAEGNSQSEATPSTSAELAAGKPERKVYKISTDLSSLSSTDLGSDSEFEALMRRRPLLEKKKMTA
ncbi:uncharacterized protein isoform X2 [Rhodnius prolixus]|uniref:uncharacterized protein isoform X2 n=1 Tax=Rhodnius prolixus TaxID=13249 RepID=UPI003D18DBAD